VPPKIPNSLPNIQIIEDFKYKIGTEVEYRCEIGFVNLFSEANKVYCQENQNWSETQFKCSSRIFLRIYCFKISRVTFKTLFFQGINCGKPTAIENGFINGVGYHYSDVVEYLCYPGFHIWGGDYIRECNLTGKWSGIEPKCERKYFIFIMYFKLFF